MIKALRLTLPPVCLLFATLARGAAPLTDRQKDVGEAGDALQYVIPVAALAFTFILDREPASPRLGLDTDSLFHLGRSPRHDLALALGRSVLLTQGLKYVVDETRPNGGRHSFPSGHTSFAFAGAEFIRKEYGWGWGIPAYATAGFVGWSRVESHQHYARDVLAGAAIGILVNHDLGELHTRYGALGLAPSSVTVNGKLVTGLQFNLKR